MHWLISKLHRWTLPIGEARRKRHYNVADTILEFFEIVFWLCTNRQFDQDVRQFSTDLLDNPPSVASGCHLYYFTLLFGTCDVRFDTRMTETRIGQDLKNHPLPLWWRVHRSQCWLVARVMSTNRVTRFVSHRLIREIGHRMILGESPAS